MNQVGYGAKRFVVGCEECSFSMNSLFQSGHESGLQLSCNLGTDSSRQGVASNRPIARRARLHGD